MKPNHQSFLDNTVPDDNEIIKATTSRENEQEKETRTPLPKLSKRKWGRDKYQLFYLMHLALLPIFLLASALTQTLPLLLAMVPYGALVLLMRRMGGGLSGRGLDYILWNIAVLVSTYANAEMPNLRQLKKPLSWSGAALFIVSSLFFPWGVAIGGVLLALGLLFAFADREAEEIAFMSRWVAIGLFATGVLGLFLAPGMALATLTLSLAFHFLFEKWDGYEFTTDVEQ